MLKIISVTNAKGGVGKTTTSINLSSALTHFNRKVLLIDMDPQANSSKGLGIDISLLSKSIFDVLENKIDINTVIRKTNVKNLDILPSKLLLTSWDEKSGENDSYFILQKYIKTIKKNYDFIIIDCPTSLGFLTINSLVASDSVLIPIQCEYFAMDAISLMLAFIAKIQTKYNPNLGIEGFLLTMYDSKTSLATEVSTSIRGLFKDNTFYTQIPRNVSIPESNSLSIPVTEFRPNSSGSLAYISLAKEILDK